MTIRTLLALSAALGLNSLRAQVGVSLTAPSAVTACPGPTENLFTVTLTNNTGSPLPAPLYVVLDLGVDLSGGNVQYGPFVQPTAQAMVVSPNSFGVAAESSPIHPTLPAIKLLDALPTGTYTIAFQGEPKSTYSFVNSNTATQGLDNLYLSRARAYSSSNTLLGSGSSAQFPLLGPKLLMPAAPDPVMIPYAANEAYRIIELNGSNGSEPANGMVILDDEHAFTNGSADPVVATKVQYFHGGAWTDIAQREAAFGPGHDRFRIDLTNPAPASQAFRTALFSSSGAQIREVFDVDDLCLAGASSLAISSTLRLGWNCSSDPGAALADQFIRFGVQLTRDASLPCLRTEQVSFSLPDCYYNGSGVATITMRIRNSGSQTGRIRRISVCTAGTTTGQMAAGTVLGSQVVLSPASPMEFTSVHAFGTAPTWEPSATITSAGSPPAGITVNFDQSTGCSVAGGETLSIIYNDGVYYELAPNEAIQYRFRIEVFDPAAGMSGPLDCTADRDIALAPLTAWVNSDHECHRLTNQEVLDNMNATTGCVPVNASGAYLINPRLLRTRTQYTGSVSNLMGACFLEDPLNPDPQMDWDVTFRLRDAISLWRRPNGVPWQNERLALEVYLEPYLYLNASDLEGANPLTITTPSGFVYSTNATDPRFRLSILDPSPGGATNFCEELHCPSYQGEQGGWTQFQRVVLMIDGFRPDSATWVQESGNMRTVSRFVNAVIDVPLRMHCPKEAEGESTEECPSYVEGCEFSPDLSWVAGASPKKMRLRLLHFPDFLGGCGGQDCSAKAVPMSCHVQTFNTQCPGCTRLGIHSDDYRIARSTYGYNDANDDGFADLPLDPITFDEALNGDYPGVESYKAMYSDLVTGRLETTIKMNCDGYGPCDSPVEPGGTPLVDLTHMYMRTSFDTPAECQGTGNLLEFVDLKMTFLEPGPGGAPFMEVTIDGSMNPTSDVFVQDQGSYYFDLSAAVLSGKPFVTMSDPALYGAGFNFDDFHDVRIIIDTRYRVACNVGFVTESVEVQNQIFLATHQQTLGLVAAFNTEFADPDIDFLSLDCQPPGSCDDYQYYCTKKGGGFTVTGYGFTVNQNYPGATGSTCDHGPWLTYRFDIENEPTGWAPQAPTNAFAREFRNWAKLNDVANTLIHFAPGDWTNGRVLFTEYTHGMRHIQVVENGANPATSRGARTIELALGDHFTYDPMSNQLLTADFSTLYSDGTRPGGTIGDNSPASLFLLPDDGFSCRVGFQYAANCETPSGPNVTQGNVRRYIHWPQQNFDWANGWPLQLVGAAPNGLPITYNKPLLSLPAYANISGSQSCWQGMVLSHTSVEPSHTPFRELWLAVDERSGFPDGMDVTYLGYSTDGGSTYIDATGGLDPESGEKYLITPIGSQSNLLPGTSVQYKVCAATPCLVPMDLNNNDTPLPPGEDPTIGDAEVILYSGWACDVAPGGLDAACNAKQLLRYVPSVPQLQVPSVQAAPVEVEGLAQCDRYEVTMELLSTGTGALSDIEIGADVSMAPGAGWSYVAGSARLLNANLVVMATAGTDLPDAIAGQGCVGGPDDMLWNLGSNGLCPTSNPVPPCARMFVRFTVERPAGDCTPMTAPIQVWARSAACGVPCQIQSTVVATAIAPAGDIVTSLSTPTITDCLGGATLQVVVENPNAQSLHGVNVTLDLPAGLVPAPPTLGCASSVQITDGDVVWGFADLPPAAPCTLSVEVNPAQCITASHNVSVSAATTCCNLSLGGELGVVEVDVEDEPCTLEPAALPTPSLCNGPWANSEILCGVATGGQPVVQFLGGNYAFVGGGAFVEYTAAQTWTLTGELVNTSDNNDRYWVQLYFDDPTPHTSWPPSAIMGTVPTGEAWTIYSVSTNPAWPSLIVGAGPQNVGDFYTISAALDSNSPPNSFGLQRGNGASGSGTNYGLGFSFVATPSDGGAAVPGILGGTMDCGYNWTHYFSPCNGQLAVTWNNPSNTLYTVSLYHDGALVSPSPMSTNQGTVVFPGLCNGVYSVTITGGGCSETLDNIVLENGIEPLTGWVEFPISACSSADACVRAVGVGGGTPGYTVEWWWQSIYPGGTPVQSQPGEWHCNAVLGEESWAKIIDANGCHITQKYYIQESQQDVASGTVTKVCGCTPGSIALEPLFDTNQPYTVAWTGPNGFAANTLSISDLVPGDYTVDLWSYEIGCSAQLTFTVDQCPGTQMAMTVQTDADPNETSWTILCEGTNDVACAGGSYASSTTITDLDCTLPDGCYRLVVSDAAGDGIVAGGYSLRVQSNADRIVDNLYSPLGLGGFTNGSTSAIANNEGFCLPLGTDRLIHTSCDIMQWRTSPCQAGNMVCNANPDVTAQYGVTNNTSGYQMWWFDPNGGYSFRRIQYHSTANGMPAGATRACHFRLNAWSGNQLQDLVLYNVRVRGIVNGTYLEWGPACRMMVDNVGLQCPRSKLLDNPANQYHSCGVTRTVGTNAFVHAQPTARLNSSCVSQSANRYQFRFRIPSEGFSTTKTATTYIVNTTGLTVGKTYEVDVRVSFDNGTTWCASGPVWGDICTVTTVAPGGMMLAATGATALTDLVLWPNPNSASTVHYRLTDLATRNGTAHWRMFDSMGRQVMEQSLGILGETAQGEIQLPADLSTGMFLVEVTVGDDRFIGRLVLQ